MFWFVSSLCKEPQSFVPSLFTRKVSAIVAFGLVRCRSVAVSSKSSAKVEKNLKVVK